MRGAGPHRTCRFCGKQAFPSRRIARKFARRIHPGKTMHAYMCPGNKAAWHLTSWTADKVENRREWDNAGRWKGQWW